MPSRRSTAFAEAFARVGIKLQCSSCGAPEKFPMTVVVLNDGEELGSCEACGGWLDQLGRPVGGDEHFKVIRLTDQPEFWQAQRRA